MHFKKILVAIDFAPASRAALRIGRIMSQRHDAPLTVCHVAIHAQALETATALVEADAGALSVGTAKRELEELLSELEIPKEECTARVLAGHGSAAPLILDLATENNLLVIGTHGKNKLEELFVGSTARTLIKDAPCPVLVARPDA